MTKMLGLIAADELAEVAEYLADEVRKLDRAGADFALPAADTPHVVFGDVRSRTTGLHAFRLGRKRNCRARLKIETDLYADTPVGPAAPAEEVRT